VLRDDSPNWLAEHRLMPGFVDFVDDMLLARGLALHPREHIRPPVIVLCHPYHRNYAHWLFDCLPWLMPWLRHLRDGRLAVLVPPLLGNWQRRTLELLGVPAGAVIEAHVESLLCDEMVIPGIVVSRADAEQAHEPGGCAREPPPQWWPRTWLAFEDAPFVELFATLRAAARPAADVAKPERIYVSRRGLESFRTMQNESEIEEMMGRLGFTIVRPQNHDFEAQVAIFSRARVVVGPHGAGLTNTLFAPTGCLVIDIFPDTWKTSWMLRLTQRFDHYYMPVVYASDPGLSHPVLLGDVEIGRSHVYRVPIDAFASAVDEAMRMIAIPDHA
jgi:Glycosyltransferase 61